MRCGKLRCLLFVVACSALLRPSSQCGGGGGGDSGLADAQRESRRQELKLWCYDNCVSAWGGWNTCSKPCAGGAQYRTRADATHSYCDEVPNFRCTQPKRESKPCNEACPYGVPIAGSCRCPPGRRGTCCETEIVCPYPTRPDHSRVEGSWPARVGGVARFSCEPGYQLTGDAVRHCSDTGAWSGSNPSCTRITCSQPGVSDQHIVLLNPKSGYVYGEHVVYTCQDGYDISGPESRECREYNATGGRWTGFAPRCDALSCPDPGVPLNGGRTGTSTNFGDVLEFTCDTGYRRLGSQRLECLASQVWFGHVPTCEQISCEAPFIPDHGSVRVRRTDTGSQAVFSCEGGYHIDGAVTIECTEQGFWTDVEPTCEAIDCGNPGQPVNGYKDGIVYAYPWSVNFACHRGYILEGRDRLTCQQNGEWTGEVPTCTACPLSTYATGDGSCASCPENAHTLSDASTSLQQCLCDDGFTGVAGGECLEVRCTVVEPPEFGSLISCNTLAGQWCNFTCNDGYVMERGTANRMCQVNGVWSGTKPICIPCAMHTYKSSDKSCTSCPANAETDSPGQMLEGCICRTGYDGPAGGPCVDTDECATPDGRGPCEDVCENAMGSYRCRCNRPGFEVDPDDSDACFPEHQCKNITEDEAPRHGGMVCNWFNQESSIFCGVRCNPGYEHPAKVNAFETCGPATGFEWSFRIKMNDIHAHYPSCIEAYFPGVFMEAETSYFTSNCQDLTADEQQQVKEEFGRILNENNVCMKSSTQLCQLKDMGIICGRTTRRRRRDTGTYEDVSEVDLAMNISAMAPITKPEECNITMCQFLRIPESRCSDFCVPAYNRFIRAAMQYAERQLTRLYSDPEQLRHMIVTAANRVFQPKETDNLQTSGVLETCDPGTALINGSCLACEPGTYYNRENNSCSLCPQHEYQDAWKQETCKPCRPGSHTPSKGSKACYVCEKGSWGAGCQGVCDCVHGMCDPFTGNCLCDSGYEGDNCSTDIPGCRENHCFAGVACHDVPAPGTGFSCGACPSGYHGDGVTCVRNSLNVARLNLEL